jgi:hypothetical protein
MSLDRAIGGSVHRAIWIQCSLTPSTLQNRNLTGVIRGVLDRPIEHEAHIVILAGDALRKSRFRKRRDQLDELRMVLPEYRDRAHPGLLGGAVEVAKILRVSKRGGLTLQALRYDLFPTSEVDHQFPDTVSFADRAIQRGFGVNAFENFHERGPMPWLALEREFELVDNERDFGH